MKSQKLVSLNPSKNYEVIGQVDISTAEEIHQKVAAARAAHDLWAKLGMSERIKLLEKLYEAFKNRTAEIAALIAQEMGMPISVCYEIDIDFGLQYMRGYLDFAPQWLAPETLFESDTELHYLFFEPRGAIGVSIPWNYPFSNFIWGVMQNLIAGNTVVCKHSEECPLTGKLLDEIIESVSLPKGVFAQLYGDGASVGEALMNSNLDMLFFTGSTGVGKHLYQVAARNFVPITLELGGSAPGIIFKDADLPTAIQSVYFFRFVNCGQTCDGLKRLIVHRTIFDQVIEQLKKLVLSKKIGDATDPHTDIGPLAAERQLIAAESQVADALAKGAQVIIGGKRPQNLLGAYYEPTILTNITREMRVWREEVFAPVLPVIAFDTEEEAIALANDTNYGLGGYMYTQDKNLALRVSNALKTGNISINNANYNIPQDPFGGYKNSGLGREHGKSGLRELCLLKTVALKK